jgi:hypothetical protein
VPVVDDQVRDRDGNGDGNRPSRGTLIGDPDQRGDERERIDRDMTDERAPTGNVTEAPCLVHRLPVRLKQHVAHRMRNE